MPRRFAAVAIMGSFCIFAGARRAGADVVVQSQNRSIEAAVREWHHDYTLDEDVEAFSQQDTAQAPNAGPFDRDLTVQYVQSYGHASQTSTIAPDRFQGSGSIGVYSETDGQTSDGGSDWKYSFQLDLTTVPEPAVFASLPALLLPLLHRRRHPVC